jgi:putative NADH-flavin reductase
MRILVFGAGGSIGGRVVNEAVGRGHDVTAVLRRGSSASADGARVVTGDVRDPLPVLRDGPHDAVVSAVGAAALSDTPDYPIYLDAAEVLVDSLRALREAAPRLLVVGGAGSLRAPSGARVIDTPEFPAQFREEALAQSRALEFLRSVSDVRWTYVSPAAMIEPGERTREFRVGGDDLLVDATGHSRISMEDYAVAMLDEIEEPRAVGRRMTVAY